MTGVVQFREIVAVAVVPAQTPEGPAIDIVGTEVQTDNQVGSATLRRVCGVQVPSDIVIPVTDMLATVVAKVVPGVQFPEKIVTAGASTTYPEPPSSMIATPLALTVAVAKVHLLRILILSIPFVVGLI